MAVDEVSLALIGSDVMAEPDTSDWAAGAVTVTTLVTVHENEVTEEKPTLSVTVMVTGNVPAVVGVPVMSAELEPIESPGGSVPPEEYVSTASPDESLGRDMKSQDRTS